jgi:putative phage-type endonuclease
MQQEPNTNSNNKPRAALRLVSTKELSRDEWLQVRKQGIGASDAAAAVGISPYQSRLELWMIKTGRDGALPKIDPNDEESPAYWGNILEPIVAEHYTKRTGLKVRRLRSVLQHPDRDKSFMLANLDYTVVGSDEVQILESKTAGEWGSRLWREGVPEYVQCQVQHQLAVTGKRVADVAVLLCGQKLEIHRIERDEELIARLVELERRFWHYVETDTPPPADGSDSSARALAALYPQDHGHEIDLSANFAMVEKFGELLGVREEVELLESYEAKLKQSLQEAMGDASRALLPQGSISWKRSKESVVLDSARLLQEKPELLKQYPLVKPGSRRFLVKANKIQPTQPIHS